MSDKMPLELLPLDSPSNKVYKKDSYINGFEMMIKQILLREAHVKPIVWGVIFVILIGKLKVKHNFLNWEEISN